MLPPIGKQKRYPSLDLTVIHASERGAPKGRKPIEWKLITDMPVRSRAEAVEKINWYAMRWKIEVFHKILKSGCKAEDLKLRTAERLANLMAVFWILSWRILWLTMLNRIVPEAFPEASLLGLTLKSPCSTNSSVTQVTDDAAPKRSPSLPHQTCKTGRLPGECPSSDAFRQFEAFVKEGSGWLMLKRLFAGAAIVCV